LVDSLIITTSTDPFTRGLDYLYGVRSVALAPEMVGLVEDLNHRTAICIWIGTHIDQVNSQLNGYLQQCHDCFHPWQQRPIQIFAAPLVQAFNLDGLCNLHTDPVTILIDVGRVVPQDWLRLVAHEYAHAQVGSPGHHAQFERSLTHLCLGLEIETPSKLGDRADWLQFYPSCVPTQDPLAFWQGNGEDWRSLN
jgi:hypothetical protein